MLFQLSRRVNENTVLSNTVVIGFLDTPEMPTDHTLGVLIQLSAVSSEYREEKVTESGQVIQVPLNRQRAIQRWCDKPVAIFS